ncbi:TPA: hypothetical protein ACIPUI_000902 [Citrobacter freundii]
MMIEGYYRVSYKGLVQIAYYYDEPAEDLEVGVKSEGVWHLVEEGRYVIFSDEVNILGGPLEQPAR